MFTCGFCASQINNYYCDFCKMKLEDNHITQDGKRLKQTDNFLGYPDQSKIHYNTSELMQLETIELLCLLSEARSFRADIYKLRVLRHKAEEQNGFNDDVKDIDKSSYEEYENATRKVWVIENIIKDRMGYYPQKVTKNFLNMYLDRMKQSEQKDMFMRNAINKKNI